MAYQALYRRYRPQTFSDVIGQEHITETLKNQLASNKVVHAYLFTGTRGTGKTSCAKILAKAVNCLDLKDGNPCGECEMCRSISDGEITDIIEIDAASNNGVDNIRELREQAKFTPAVSKYRVYIIDEVHMLSQPAFNALLKTLEEPPKHVVFILATTEVHKLPATILSRCQRYDFRRISPEKITERIMYIANKENLTVTPDAATLIASAADGGMRDALSIMDLCASSNSNIDEDVVASVCSMAGNDYLINLADCISKGDNEGAILLLDSLHNSSVDMLRLLSELTKHFRDLMIIKTVKGQNRPVVCSAKRLKDLENQAEKFDITQIMYVLNVLQSASASMQTGNRRCEMEMAIIKLCNPKVVADTSALEIRILALENQIKTGKAAIIQEEAEIEPIQNEEIIEEPSAVPQKEDDKPLDSWSEILDILKTSCPLIYGVLGDSNAYIRGNYLLIETNNTQFRSLVNGSNPLYRDSIRKAAYTVLGETYKLGPYRKNTATVEADPLFAFAEKLKNLENN